MPPASDNFNAINRGVYIADNYDFLTALNTESVDLVCIDPPFAKNETFGRKSARAKDPLKPPLTEAERDNELRLLQSWGINSPADADQAGINWPETAYKDFWSWETDIHEEWLINLRATHQPIADLIAVTRRTHSESVAAYLCYMAVRLLEIHRILKPTGSLYLHCDHTANGYLRQALDAIFGRANFRNEIAWCYNKWTNAAMSFQNNHDTILFYTKADGYTFNKQYHITGRKQVSIDRGWETNTVQGGKRQIMVYDWNKADAEIASKPAGHYDRVIDMNRKPPGSAIPDWWEGIPYLNSQAKERAGYPTQKPVALAERIIAASANEGDIVLDCFAGCAYVAVAAERLRRRWVACDIQPRAWTVFKRQFNKPQLALLNCHDLTTGQQVLSDAPVVTIHGPGELPRRDYRPGESPDDEAAIPDIQLPEPKFKIPASLIPEREMLARLLELSDYKAWCCGFANRMPDGAIVRTTRNFHLDHIAPRSRRGTGTSNEIQNRAPMCPDHNIRKSNRRIALAEYRAEIADAGDMLVNTVDELIDLDYAFHHANRLYLEADRRRRNPARN